jgi:hypothetical protein
MAKDPISAEQQFVASGKMAIRVGLTDAARQSNYDAVRRLKHPLSPVPPE